MATDTATAQTRMHLAIATISMFVDNANKTADECGEYAPLSAKDIRSTASQLSAVLAPLQWRDGDPTSPGYWWVKTKGMPPAIVGVNANLFHIYYHLNDRANPFQCAGPIPMPV